MAKEITEFRGEWRFLSNFWPCDVKLGEIVFPSAEHGYQARKSLMPEVQLSVAQLATPGDAKRYGRKIVLRPDWEQVKKRVMLLVVLSKFTQNPDLVARLAATEDAYLEEGNTWHDNYWGACRCDDHTGDGLNYLGRILMMARDIVRAD
jgi:ribA/ribD-fused uncharacterized protein